MSDCTKKVYGKASFGYVGCEHQLELEVPCDATEDDINQALWEQALDYVEAYQVDPCDEYGEGCAE